MSFFTAACVQVSRFSMWDANSSLDCRLINCSHRTSMYQTVQHVDCHECSAAFHVKREWLTQVLLARHELCPAGLAMRY